MWIHFLILGFIILFSIIGNSLKNGDMFSCISIFLLLYFFSAFRGINVGNDTIEYYRIFNLVLNQDSIMKAISSSRYEPGYMIYNYIVSRFTDNFSYILSINAGFYLFSVIKFIKRYSRNINYSMILFFTFGMYYNIMSLQRQCIAMAILLFAIPLLESKKNFSFILVILFASTFHFAVLISIMLLFLPNIDFSKKNEINKWIILSIIFLLILKYTGKYILVYFPYLSHYLINSVYSTGGVRLASISMLLIRLISLSLILIVKGRLYFTENSNEYIIFNKVVVLDCIFTLASIGFNMFDRIEKYFGLIFIVAITNLIEEMNINNKKITFMIIFILSFTYLTLVLIIRPEWWRIFPYVFS